MNNKRNILIVFILMLGFVSAFTQTDKQQTAEAVKTNVKYLSSDELEGRFPGTPGSLKAIEYIQNFFKTNNVQPINGTYTSEFPITQGIKIGDNVSFVFKKLVEKPGVPEDMWRTVDKKWNVSQDWQPMSFSEDGNVNAEVAFVGYGITAKDLNYDDYEGIDVKGKICLIIIDSSENQRKDEFAKYSSVRYKATNARDHGAKAVIFVKRQGDSANTFIPLKYSGLFGNSGVVAVQVTRTQAATLFPPDRQLYVMEQEINKKKTPKSFILPRIKVALTVSLRPETINVQNVFGYVKGSDPELAKEYIVIGAHFDHLGYGGWNSLDQKGKQQIHNGADDNASGTSAMMELSRRIAANPLKRSVIFVGFNCEELGLNGSAAFAKNPPVPISNIVFMLNLDMIGRAEKNTISIFGTGTSSNFNTMIDEFATKHLLTTVKASDGFSPSDHSSFYAQKIPVLFIFSGLHDDYHKPSDDWDKLNYEGIATIIDFSESIVKKIADTREKPDYKQTTSNIFGGDSTKPSMGMGKGAYFGIVPNFAENEKGLIINGASAGSPAQKAGLQKDDIIIQFGEKPIKNLYDLTYALMEREPGDTVTVKFIRNGKEESVEVELTRKKK